jgi:hypothetical protein
MVFEEDCFARKPRLPENFNVPWVKLHQVTFLGPWAPSAASEDEAFVINTLESNPKLEQFTVGNLSNRGMEALAKCSQLERATIFKRDGADPYGDEALVLLASNCRSLQHLTLDAGDSPTSLLSWSVLADVFYSCSELELVVLLRDHAIETPLDAAKLVFGESSLGKLVAKAPNSELALQLLHGRRHFDAMLTEQMRNDSLCDDLCNLLVSKALPVVPLGLHRFGWRVNRKAFARLYRFI